MTPDELKQVRAALEWACSLDGWAGGVGMVQPRIRAALDILDRAEPTYTEEQVQGELRSAWWAGNAWGQHDTVLERDRRLRADVEASMARLKGVK